MLPRNDNVYYRMPRDTSYANFTSHFRPPVNLAGDYFSGRDELREWNGENTSNKKPRLDAVLTWSDDSCPLETSDARDATPMPKSLHALLATVTKLAKHQTSDQKPTRGRKRKTPELHETKPLSSHATSGCSITVASKKVFECHLCKKSFTAKSTLKVHMRIHTGSKPYHCQQCNRSFRDFSTFTKHQRTHTGERPYTCAVCGVGFTQSGNMKRHFLSQHLEYDISQN
jgi:hypothetical protein